MKPCASNRKLIVWLTLTALDAQQTRQLRAHLDTCEGCRRYLAEISNVTKKLATVEMNPDVQASESFHRSVARKLQATKPHSFREILAAYVQRSNLNWRVAVPVAAALVFIGTILAIWPEPPHVAPRPSATTSMTLASVKENDLAPTIANYQRTADQSLEKLDALLTQQGKQALPVMPRFNASPLGLANESF